MVCTRVLNKDIYLSAYHFTLLLFILSRFWWADFNVFRWIYIHLAFLCILQNATNEGNVNCVFILHLYQTCRDTEC